MRKRLERYIPEALKAVEACGIAKNGQVARPFNGYISSFGAGIRQAGVVPTVLFFTSQTDRSEEERGKIVDAIETILGQPLIQKGRQNPDVDRDMIEDAATALKLALRTYTLVDKE